MRSRHLRALLACALAFVLSAAGAAPASHALDLRTLTTNQALSCPAAPGVQAGEAPRHLAFELAFGANSPYALKYGETFDDLDYQRKAAITAEVLDYVVPLALRLAGVVAIARSYGPGGYEQFVNPSGQLVVCGSADDAENVMRIIGFLAQQTEVYGSRPDPDGPNSAIDIYQTNGTHLRDPAVAAELFYRLGELEPDLSTGFQPLEFRDTAGRLRVGIRIINVDGSWSREEIAGFAEPIRRASEAVSRSRGIDLGGEWQDLRVELFLVGNNWRTMPDGSDYLQGLSAAGRPEISRALVDQHRPEVERRIQAALARYAGGPAPAQLP